MTLLASKVSVLQRSPAHSCERKIASKLFHGMAIWKYGWALRIDQYFISLVKRRSVHPHVIFRVYDDRLSDGVENMDMVCIP